jgi:hypothetical protein
MANETRITKSGKSTLTKFPSKGPLPLHKSIAVGDSLSSAQSEGRVGGSKSDKSNKTNR